MEIRPMQRTTISPAAAMSRPTQRPAARLAFGDRPPAGADAHEIERSRVRASLLLVPGRDKPVHRRWA
jgi:hypothetical protein